MQTRRDLAGGVEHVGEVGLPVLPERRGHADEHGIALGQTVEVGGGSEADAAGRVDPGPGCGHALRPDVADVALAALEAGDLLGVDVEAEHAEPGLHEHQRQRQSHVALADHAHDGGAVLDEGQEAGGVGRSGSGSSGVGRGGAGGSGGRGGCEGPVHGAE